MRKTRNNGNNGNNGNKPETWNNENIGNNRTFGKVMQIGIVKGKGGGGGDI